MKKGLHIDNSDNVVVALTDIHQNEVIQGIPALQDVRMGHKIACRKIEQNESIIKYGHPIGIATKTIYPGQWVHSHNMATTLSQNTTYTYQPLTQSIPPCYPPHQVMAYRRQNGKVGIRNELWIIPTVGCINSIAKGIIQRVVSTLCLQNIDGIYTFEHPYGCSQMGEDHATTVRLLQRIVEHPNAGGVLVLGLGCENNQLDPFVKGLQNIDQDRIAWLNCQDCQDEISCACNLIKPLLSRMEKDQRTPCDLKDFTFGLKCGGSDGLSGITANPLLGSFSDLVLRQGARIILSEVPEMFGAEQILMNRAINKEVFDKTVTMIQDFKDYFHTHHQVVYENPSFGNKEGGITTLEEKSLGCIQKAGHGLIQDVIPYGFHVKKEGISLLVGPGNDLVSVTALGAAGCQLVLFTTGRGTPFGGFIPTFKVSTNCTLAAKKSHWIDYNAGVLTQKKTIEQATQELFEQVISTLEGKQTANEINACREIAIFKQGVTC